MPHINLDGYISATQLIKIIDNPQLDNWRAKVGIKKATKLSEAGANWGTEFHRVMEDKLKMFSINYLTGDQFQPYISPDEKVMQAANLLWKKIRHKIKPIWIEHTFKDDGLMLQGTPDLLEEHCVWDWKTSNTRDPKRTVLQLSIYAHLYNKSVGLTWEQGIDKGMEVHIDKRGKTVKVDDPIEYVSLHSYFPLVLELLDIWNFMNKWET